MKTHDNERAKGEKQDGASGGCKGGTKGEEQDGEKGVGLKRVRAKGGREGGVKGEKVSTRMGCKKGEMWGKSRLSIEKILSVTQIRNNPTRAKEYAILKGRAEKVAMKHKGLFLKLFEWYARYEETRCTLEEMTKEELREWVKMKEKEDKTYKRYFMTAQCRALLKKAEEWDDEEFEEVRADLLQIAESERKQMMEEEVRTSRVAGERISAEDERLMGFWANELGKMEEGDCIAYIEKLSEPLDLEGLEMAYADAREQLLEGMKGEKRARGAEALREAREKNLLDERYMPNEELLWSERLKAMFAYILHVKGGLKLLAISKCWHMKQGVSKVIGDLRSSFTRMVRGEKVLWAVYDKEKYRSLVYKDE